ncbi:MAG: hypothetical protein ACOZNI_16280 [Myxococcota bacterium]
MIATADDRRRRIVVVADDIVEATRKAVAGLATLPNGPWALRSIRYLSKAFV